MRGPSRKVTYDANSAREAIELMQAGIDRIVGIVPILDALYSIPNWTHTEATALMALGEVIGDLADDIGGRSRILRNPW